MGYKIWYGMEVNAWIFPVCSNTSLENIAHYYKYPLVKRSFMSVSKFPSILWCAKKCIIINIKWKIDEKVYLKAATTETIF